MSNCPWDGENIPLPEYEPIDDSYENTKVVSIKKTKHKKKQQNFSSEVVWAESVGELLDRELSFYLNEKNMSFRDAFLEIGRKESYSLYWHTSKKKPLMLSDRAIKNAYDRHYIKQKEKALEYIKETLKYDGHTQMISAVSAIQALITPVLVEKSHAEAIAFGIAQWLWQVKRRIYNLNVDNHIVIGFINSGSTEDGQGAGKTTFALNMLKPFMQKYGHKFEDHLFANTDLATISDKKAWADILSRYVVFLDDICPESKNEVATLKSIFTCDDTKAARGNYESHLTATKVKMSAIFTCNADNFGDVIKDVSGNRRYLPIHCLNFKGKIDKDFDFLPFWQMINHEWPCFTDLRMFKKIQSDHITGSSLSLLLDLYSMTPWKKEVGGDCAHIFPCDIKLVLNKHFPSEKKFTTKRMTSDLLNLGFEKTEKAGRDRNRLAYLINFGQNCFKRWQQNFHETVADNPDLRHPSITL